MCTHCGPTFQLRLSHFQEKCKCKYRTLLFYPLHKTRKTSTNIIQYCTPSKYITLYLPPDCVKVKKNLASQNLGKGSS